MNWNDVYLWVIIALLAMAAAGIYSNGFGKTLPTLLVAVITALIIDALMKRLILKKWIASKSAIISGLIVGSIISFEDPIYIPFIASTIAILSKYLIKYKVFHAFNPATFGMVATFFLFSKYDSWWAVVPILSPLLAVVAWKIRRLYIAVSFLIVLATLGYLTNNLRIQSFTDLLGLPFYFALIMAVEPKTTPSLRNQQIVFGVFLAVLYVLFAFYLRVPYSLLISLLAMNLGFFIYRIRR